MDENAALYLDGVDLQFQLDDAFAKTYECINDMVPLREVEAGLVRDYKVKRAERTIYERDVRKTPVSIIDAIVKGSAELAEIEYQHAIAEEKCKNNFEAILFHKKRADAIRDQIGREWANARNVM